MNPLLTLWGAAALAARSMDVPTLTIGFGGLLAGLVPLAWIRFRFRRRAPRS